MKSVFYERQQSGYSRNKEEGSLVKSGLPDNDEFDPG
jgi:hypothetical protein